MLFLPDLPMVYERYLTLSHISGENFGGSLSRKLVFLNCFDRDGVATVIAATVAGGASLCVDDDAGRLRDGLRTGLCDFVVGTLDEALRILKNEVRRGIAVSVGLTAGEEGCFAAIRDRGVQPDLVALKGEKFRETERALLESGAIRLPMEQGPFPDTALFLWSVDEEPARVLPLIAELAAGALDPERPDTTARRSWLRRAPRTLGRAFGSRQCSRMTQAEAEDFLQRVRQQFPKAALMRDGEPIQIPAAI